MSVSSLHTYGYGSLASSWGMDINNLNNGDGARNSRASGGSSSSGSSHPYGNTMSGGLNGLASALSGAMDELGLSANDRLTFQTLMEYRDRLQEQFTEKVKKDLRELGVDENVNFRLTSGSGGSGVEVVTDSEDRAVIEKYFKDNPDMVKQFEKLISLNKMEETRKSQNIDVKAIRSRIQMESMTAWYSDSNSFMAFTGQGAAYYSGLNALV